MVKEEVPRNASSGEWTDLAGPSEAMSQWPGPWGVHVAVLIFGEFSKSGKNKVTLIERYINSEAVLLHIKNISPGGKISKDFEEFQKVFIINNMTLYGNVSNDLKKAIEPFNIKTKYVPVIAGYSR